MADDIEITFTRDIVATDGQAAQVRSRGVIDSSTPAEVIEDFARRLGAGVGLTLRELPEDGAKVADATFLEGVAEHFLAGYRAGQADEQTDRATRDAALPDVITLALIDKDGGVREVQIVPGQKVPLLPDDHFVMRIKA